MLPVRKRMATDKMKCRRAAPGLFTDRREAVLFSLTSEKEPPAALYEKMMMAYFIRQKEEDMRLDKFLKVSRLIKRRTVANEACDAGRVLLNDRPAKASAAVKAGDILEIQFGTKAVRVEVLNVQETVKKDDAKELYRYL